MALLRLCANEIRGRVCAFPRRRPADGRYRYHQIVYLSNRTDNSSLFFLLPISHSPLQSMQSMSGALYLLLSPVLLLISIPLTIFAAFTTTLAFSTLFFRALLIYAELAAALIQDQYTSSDPPKTTAPLPASVAEDKSGRRKSRRGSAASGSSTGSTTPRAPKSSGLGVYGGEGATRDFEGVGGWRIPGPDGEDELWTSMNSRLELPAMVDVGHRNHRRSRTFGSLNSPNSRLSLHLPVNPRAWSPHDRSASPEEYFASRLPSKSTTALDAANIGKGLLRHKPSSSSSGSSQSSVRTHHLTLSNT